jgi:hypothetical protein
MGRHFLLTAAIALTAVTAAAQTSHSTFSIGPRVSSFSTDVDGEAGYSVKTGRENAFGIVGDYRTGRFMLDFSWDTDSSEGLNFTTVFIDVSDYQHQRGEFAGGYAVTPFLDLQAGFRDESYQIGGFSFLGSSFGSNLNFDHQALIGGLHFHSDLRQQVVAHVKVRGYIGSAKFDNSLGQRIQTDTTGWLGEASADIRFGESNWYIVPGAEWDRVETSDYDLRFNTNRFLLSVLYRSR